MIPRYSLPEMSAVWSDQARLQHWLDIEVLACEAWADLGRIPQEDLQAIRDRASSRPTCGAAPRLVATAQLRARRVEGNRRNTCAPA